MKFVEDRPYAKPQSAAARLLEIANGIDVSEGKVDVGQVNIVFLREGGNPDEYRAGMMQLRPTTDRDAPGRHLHHLHRQSRAAHSLIKTAGCRRSLCRGPCFLRLPIAVLICSRYRRVRKASGAVGVSLRLLFSAQRPRGCRSVPRRVTRMSYFGSRATDIAGAIGQASLLPQALPRCFWSR